jgi:hypothetical protein
MGTIVFMPSIRRRTAIGSPFREILGLTDPARVSLRINQ